MSNTARVDGKTWAMDDARTDTKPSSPSDVERMHFVCECGAPVIISGLQSEAHALRVQVAPHICQGEVINELSS